MKPFVRIVVLNHNSGTLLATCLSSLQTLDWPTDRREIVVIDNASTDGSDQIAAAAPDVTLVRNPRGNTGFSANNLAFEDLDGVDHVALVNPDSRVAPDWLTHLACALGQDGGLGAACPKILLDEGFAELDVSSPGRVVVTAAQADGVPATFHLWPRAEPLPGDRGTIWHGGRSVTVRVAAPPEATTISVEICSSRSGPGAVAGSSVEFRTSPDSVTLPAPARRTCVLQHAGCFRHRNGNAGDIGWLDPDGTHWNVPADVQGWCGASVLLRAEYLRDVGGFDESFFLYYEDADLSWRGEKRGWRYRYVPEAVAWHHQSATIGIASPLAIHHQWRNRLRMIRKHAGVVAAARTLVRMAGSTCGLAARLSIDRPAIFRAACLRMLGARLRRPRVSAEPGSAS